MVAGPRYPHPIPRPPAAGCSCYVEYRQTIGQEVPGPAGGAGDRADVLEVAWDTINTCGDAPAAGAMLVLSLAWQWTQDFYDPYVVSGDAGLGTPGLASARGVYVFPGAPGPNPFVSGDPFAMDTRLGTGQSWVSDNGKEGGTLTVPVNIFPAGQAFTVYVAQSSSTFLNLDITAVLYTVCACECVQ